MTLRSAFSRTAASLLDSEPRLVILLGDIGVYAMRDAMAKHPKRCINMGICESATVDFAAGLAAQGYVPLFHTIDAFLVRRAYESIYIGFGLQRLPGIFVSVGGVGDYPKLGPTHSCVEGSTLMAQIPGMHIRMPVSEQTVDLAIRTAVERRQLTYIRLEESQAVNDTEPVVVPLHLGAGNGISSGHQR